MNSSRVELRYGGANQKNSEFDFSSHRARSLMLQRGITNTVVADAIRCHPKSVQRMVNGRVEYRRGKLYQRFREYLASQNSFDIVKHLDLVTLRNSKGRVSSLGEIRRKRKTVRVVKL